MLNHLSPALKGLEIGTGRDRAFEMKTGSLAPDGLMVYYCPNYNIPFEPHFNIPLVPFKTEWTPLFYPGLRWKALWQGLKFTTVGGITRLCKRHGLHPAFRKGKTAKVFEQVLTDPVFRARKQGFVKITFLLKTIGMMKVLARLPSVLNTPMEFTATKVSYAFKPLPG